MLAVMLAIVLLQEFTLVRYCTYRAPQGDRGKYGIIQTDFKAMFNKIDLRNVEGEEAVKFLAEPRQDGSPVRGNFTQNCFGCEKISI